MLTVISMSETVEAKDKRLYYKAEFKDNSNPFSKPVPRMIFQRTTPDGNVWDADPKDIAKLVGKMVKGEIVSKEVPEYIILNKDGTERKVNTYTTIVFGHENALSVFKNAGHDYSDSAKVAVNETDEVGITEPNPFI